MSYLDAASGSVVSSLNADQRAGFIRRTYAHLAMGIGTMILACAVFLSIGLGPILLGFLTAGMLNMLIFMVLFIGAGIVADRMAQSQQSTTIHYVGLFGYAVVEAVVVTPILYLASVYKPYAIMDALFATAALTAGLSWIAFATKKDFSFMGKFLVVGSFIALGTIFAGVIFSFSIGLVGTSLIILLACGFILYNTSNIIHHYQEHQHVAAALSLFASIALLFRFILQLFMSFDD